MFIMTPSGLPKVSIDVVPLRVLSDGSVQVGLGIRSGEPFKGHRALPGVLLLGGELLEQAGFRALKSKVGVNIDNVHWLQQFSTFDSPTRDPRGHTLSIAMFAVIKNDVESKGIEWFALDGTGELPFDHTSIIKSAVDYIYKNLWESSDLVYSLLGNSFSTALAYRVTEQLAGEPLDKSNFNRKISSLPFLSDSGYTDREHTGKGRPSKVWCMV